MRGIVTPLCLTSRQALTFHFCAVLCETAERLALGMESIDGLCISTSKTVPGLLSGRSD